VIWTRSINPPLTGKVGAKADAQMLYFGLIRDFRNRPQAALRHISQFHVNATFTPDSIHSALSRLSREDAGRALFGANGHQYQLHSPIDASVVSEFEQQNGVSLPDDYRFFITEIGDGGAGPAYGVFRFGEEDDGFGFCKWSEGYLVGDLAKPFVHSGSWNHSKEFWAKEPTIAEDMAEEERDRLTEEWDSLINAEYWSPSVMDGAIPICHLGCALRQWLVVTGPQRGYVWDDSRADYKGLAPVLSEGRNRVTFEDWYMSWLRSALRKYA
jgi:hypothetical protein